MLKFFASEIALNPTNRTMPNAFNELVLRCRSGDAQAMAELIELYEADVRIVARARIGVALRPHIDSVDLMQSLHRSVLLGLRNQRFEIETPEQLCALALTIVQRKAARHWRRAVRQQRLSGVLRGASLHDRLLEIRTQDPSLQQPELDEIFQQLVSQLSTEDQQLLQLRLEGYSTVDAARSLKLDPDVTRARLSRLRKKLVRAKSLIDLI